MDWKQNKIIFNYIASKKYLIKKDTLTNNILYIGWDKFEMKCKYFMAFSINNEGKIFWSCDNPYIDQKTQYLSHTLKSNLKVEQKIYNSDILNMVKNLIHSGTSVEYDGNKINFLWGLVGNYKTHKQFYVITEIVHI